MNTNTDTDTKLYKRLFSLTKSKAKQRGKEWSLDLEQFTLLVSSPCSYCGSLPSNGNRLKYRGETLHYNGIDRIDSALGYEEGNLLTSCKFCNSLKGPMKKETWFSFIDAVSRYRRDKVPFLAEEGIEGDSARSRKSFHRY